MQIDWDGMSHSMLTEQLQRGLAVREKRIAELEALTSDQPRAETRGRPRKSAFPDNARGALDAVGDAQ